MPRTKLSHQEHFERVQDLLRAGQDLRALMAVAAMLGQLQRDRAPASAVSATRTLLKALKEKTGAELVVETDNGLVVVERADMPDADVRWETTCLNHGGVVGHKTKEDAINWAHSPEHWCPYCSGEEEWDVDDRENPRSSEATDRARVRTLVRDWQHHKQDFENTAYWRKRFAALEPVLSRYRPKGPVVLYRSERTDIDNRYADRFTSWSWDHQIKDFGWGERRLVEGVFNPEAVAADLVALGLDTEHLREVVIKPGNYDIVPVKWVWDSWGMFNAYREPERAARAGFRVLP